MENTTHPELLEAALHAEWRLIYYRPRQFTRAPLWLQAVAALLTLALHALAIGPMLYGTSNVSKPSRSAHGGSASTLILLAPEITAAEATDWLQQFTNELAFTTLPFDVVLPSPNLAAEDGSSAADAQAEKGHQLPEVTGPERGAMFTRYVGQVGSRVERAWVRPRTPLSAPFKCSTRIDQDNAGRIVTVELMECNGDVGWQQSLVFAIQRASPLAVPPDPSIFTPTLVMTFTAESYVEGWSNPSEYEPGSPVIRAASGTQ